MMFIKGITFLAFGISLIGCASEREPAEFDLFETDFRCTASQVADCELDAIGRKVYLGLAFNPALSCADLFNRVGVAQLHLSFDFVSQTVAEPYGTDMVWGRFSSYTNSEEEVVSAIYPGEYLACAFIDMNFNGFLDSGEPLMTTPWNPRLDIDRIFTQWGSAP